MPRMWANVGVFDVETCAEKNDGWRVQCEDGHNEISSHLSMSECVEMRWPHA